MNKKPGENDLGIPLKEAWSIIESGRKLTRGAINQFKLNSDKQIVQKQSQISYDSQKSIPNRKDSKKGQKSIKKKQGSSKSIQIQLNSFIGLPDLDSYIQSQKLQIQTINSENPKMRFSELQKTLIPNLIRVLLKHTSIYQVKKGQFKKNGGSKKQQFLIDLSSSTNRSDVRQISKQHGFVLVGQNMVMAKINFSEFKQIFQNDLQNIKREFYKSQKSLDSSINQNQQQQSLQVFKDEIIQQQKIDLKKEKSKTSQKEDQIEEESISFVEIKKDDQSIYPSEQKFQQIKNRVNEYQKSQMDIQKDNIEQNVKQKEQSSEKSIHQEVQNNFIQTLKVQNENDQQKPSYQCDPQNKEIFQEKKQNCIDNQKYISTIKFFQQRNYKKISTQIKQPTKTITDEQIFMKFCIPGLDYILWPAIVYEPIMGNQQEIIEVINKNKYFFNQKEQFSIFQTISKSSSLFEISKIINVNSKQPKSQKSNKSKELIDSLQENSHKGQYTEMNRFLDHIQSLTNNEKNSKEKSQEQLKDMNSKQNQTQLNLIVYLLGSNKIVYFPQKRLFSWSIFSKQFLNNYILKSYFQQFIQQIGHTIDQLNIFTRQQQSQCKTDDIRNSLDRLSKCKLQNRIFNGIPLRYSNIQKKMLVMVFKNKKNLQNELVWMNIDQIYPNYTVPQLSLKNKFLLYFTNFTKNNKNLKQFIKDIYSSYLYTDFQLKPYIQNEIQIPNSDSSEFQINRCVECFYPIYKMPSYKCFFCQTYCHTQCTTKSINKSLEANLGHIQNLWVCNSCQPCNLCFQPLGTKRTNCLKCNNMFHEICGKLKMQQNSTHRDKYLCQNCIQCQICDKKLKNLDYSLIKGGYQCQNCRKAEENNQICHICKKSDQGGKWIQCSRQFCNKWIHKNCDRYLQSRNHLFEKNNQEIYFCPFCRKVQRRKLILKCIEIISIFDQYQYFIGSDYQDILDYRYVIINPMCLKKMNQRCLQGSYDENPLEKMVQDFQLLIQNALKYNMPKDQPHYQARILNILGKFSLQKLKQQIQCTQQQIIHGRIYQRILDKRKEIFRQIYQRYLEILLNFKSTRSIVEVKRPLKQKNQKISTNFDQPFVFSSRTLLNQVFKSSIVKFKLKKKSPKIQNLFQIQKVTDAYKSPMKQNVCYYHYWNSNVIFYCSICMEYYCCATVCYKHSYCPSNNCGIKGCACQVYQCGCPPLKDKQRKNYQKQIQQKFYQKRQITQNYKLCLKCAFQKLTTKVCAYCQRSYEFYYDFQKCKSCYKIYHKECGDIHASSNLGNFFFKKQKNSPQEQLFSNSLRLENMCYECSTNSQNKSMMFEKLKRESLSKLIKLHKLYKYEFLVASIYTQHGIKLSLNEIFTLIQSNYDQFQKYENLFQQYRQNLSLLRITSKQNRKFQQKISGQIQHKILKEYINQIKSKPNKSCLNQLLNSYQDVDKLFGLYQQSNSSINKTLYYRKCQQFNQNKIKQFIVSTPLQHHYFSQSQFFNYRKLRTQINFKKFQKCKVQFKIRQQIGKIQSSKTQIVQKQVSNVGLSLGINKKAHYLMANIGNTNNPGATSNKGTTNFKQSSSKHINTQKSEDKQQIAMVYLDSLLKITFKNFIEIQIDQIDYLIPKQQTNQILQRQEKYMGIKFSNRQNNNLICLLSNFNSEDFLRPIKSYFPYQYYQFKSECIFEEPIQINEDNNNKILQKQLRKGQPESLILDTHHRNIQSKYAKRNEQSNKDSRQTEIMGTKNNRSSQRLNNQTNNQPKTFNSIKIQSPTTSRQTEANIIQIEQQLQRIMNQRMQLEQQTNEQSKVQPQLLEHKLMKIHCQQNNLSTISKYKRLVTIHKFITKFLLRCFQFNKLTYRRGNTCIIKSQPNHWRVLKKTDKVNQYYQIRLKKEDNNKWYFSINQNVWIIDSIEQIINKLKCIIQLENFRQLADFLGFTLKFVTVEKANHFTELLRTNPLDKLSAHSKKVLITQCYDKYQWNKNGVFKLKKGNDIHQESKEFIPNKKKLFYLKKVSQKNQQQSQRYANASTPSYITYQDLKKDLQDVNIMMQKQKNEKINLKQPGDNVFIAPSPIHKLGLFAKQDYPKHTSMVQYIGQIVSESIADIRQSKFQFGCYMFGLNRRNVDKRQIIDATFRGNMARYLNHSCQPNCKAKVEVVNNNPRIFIYSIRDIKQFQQLTYDYQFKIDADQKIMCTCGSKNCQGRLN